MKLDTVLINILIINYSLKFIQMKSTDGCLELSRLKRRTEPSTTVCFVDFAAGFDSTDRRALEWIIEEDRIPPQ